MATKSNKFEIATTGAAIHCTAKGRVTTTKHSVNIINNRLPRMTTDAYQKECAKWEEAYGEKATPEVETMHDKIKRYQGKADRLNTSQPHRNRDKGAR